MRTVVGQLTSIATHSLNLPLESVDGCREQKRRYGLPAQRTQHSPLCRVETRCTVPAHPMLAFEEDSRHCVGFPQAYAAIVARVFDRRLMGALFPWHSMQARFLPFFHCDVVKSVFGRANMHFVHLRGSFMRRTFSYAFRSSREKRPTARQHRQTRPHMS